MAKNDIDIVIRAQDAATKELKNVYGELGSLNNEIKIQDKQWKAYSISTDKAKEATKFLTTQQKHLESQMKNVQAKTILLNAAIEKSKTANGENTRETQRLKNQLANLGVQEAKLKKQMDKVTVSIEKNNSVLKRQAAFLKKHQDTIKNVGRSLSMGLTLPLIGTAAAAIKMSTDFEQALANAASVSGAAGNQLKEMETIARNMGKTTVFSAKEAGDAMYYMASAGWDVSKMGDAIKPVLDLAAATQSNLASTTDSVVATLNQFELQAADASKVSNVFAAAIGDSQATMEKLSLSMRYVGPVANSLGYSLEDTTAALMGLYDAGFKGEQAGTVLRGTLSRLSKPTKEITDALDEMGLSFEDVNPATRSLAEIIGILGDKGITTRQAVALFAQEAGPGMMALISKGQKAIEDYEKAITGTNKATEMAERQTETFQGQLKKLKSQTSEVAIQIGNELIPILRDLIDKHVMPAVDWFSTLDDGTRNLMLVMGALAAALGPVLILVGSLTAAISAMSGPIGIVALAVGGLTGAYLGFQAHAEASTQAIKENTSQLIEASQKAREQASQVKNLTGRFEELQESTDDTKTKQEKLHGILEDVRDVAPEVAGKFSTMEDALLNSKDAAKGLKDELKELHAELLKDAEVQSQAAEAQLPALKDVLKGQAADVEKAASQLDMGNAQGVVLEYGTGIQKLKGFTMDFREQMQLAGQIVSNLDDKYQDTKKSVTNAEIAIKKFNTLQKQATSSTNDDSYAKEKNKEATDKDKKANDDDTDSKDKNKDATDNQTDSTSKLTKAMSEQEYQLKLLDLQWQIDQQALDGNEDQTARLAAEKDYLGQKLDLVNTKLTNTKAKLDKAKAAGKDHEGEVQELTLALKGLELQQAQLQNQYDATTNTINKQIGAMKEVQKLLSSGDKDKAKTGANVWAADAALGGHWDFSEGYGDKAKWVSGGTGKNYGDLTNDEISNWAKNAPKFHGGKAPGNTNKEIPAIINDDEWVIPDDEVKRVSGGAKIDYEKLSQVLSDALVNALKGATVKGEVTVNIEQGSGKMRQFRLAF